MSNIQKQHKISPAIAWLTIQKFIIFYCPLDGEHTNQHQMEQFLSVLTKYRNVCAHGERLFTYRTVDAIADTPLHKKLSLPQSGNQYEKGKQDLFAVVIAFRYLLPGKDFLEFKRKLIKEIDRVNREVEHISEVELLNKMGFPENWKSITKYHLK